MSFSTIGGLDSIGATIRFWREQRAWTRTRLAAETRLDLPTISDIEAGWEGVNFAHLAGCWEGNGRGRRTPTADGGTWAGRGRGGRVCRTRYRRGGGGVGTAAVRWG